MTVSHEPVSTTRSVTLDAPVTEVWDEVADPDGFGSFLGGPTEVDLRPGGVGRALLEDGDRSILITAVEPGRRLSWQWATGDGEISSVEVVFEEEDEEPATRVTVIERSFVALPAGGAATAQASAAWSGLRVWAFGLSVVRA